MPKGEKGTDSELSVATSTYLARTVHLAHRISVKREGLYPRPNTQDMRYKYCDIERGCDSNLAAYTFRVTLNSKQKEKEKRSKICRIIISTLGKTKNGRQKRKCKSAVMEKTEMKVN